jgi:glyoxylase-like metal-dependent hydrolase (beta-lactamase superfamily II)
MQKILRFAVALSSLLLTVSAMAISAPLSETSQRQAKQILDRAVTAMGGEDLLRNIQTVRLQNTQEEWPYQQSTTVKPPFQATKAEQTLLLDIPGNRMRFDASSLGAGFESRTTLTLKNGQGMAYNHVRKTALPQESAQWTPARLAPYSRVLPSLLLRQALEQSASLRHLGRADFNKRRHDVITFVGVDALQIALYIDIYTGLVSKYETVSAEFDLGNRATEVIFSDYVGIGAHLVPRLSTQRYAGMLSMRSQLTTEFNSPDFDKNFEFVDPGYQRVNRLPRDFAPRVEKLADGVSVLHNIAGPNYNTMVVAFKDYVVAVEAPFNSEGSDKVITRIKEEFPNKPIRFVVVTHHHRDHIGGLRSYIAEGAIVVTTRANKAVIEELAALKLRDRLGAKPRKPEFLFVDGAKRAISDGEQTLELLQIGPVPHADDMLVAYLPTIKIIFQGDMFFVPSTDGPLGSPPPVTVTFAQRLRELGVSVERIVGAHGRSASIAELAQAVESNTKQL